MVDVADDSSEETSSDAEEDEEEDGGEEGVSSLPPQIDAPAPPAPAAVLGDETDEAAPPPVAPANLLVSYKFSPLCLRNSLFGKSLLCRIQSEA